EETYYYSGKGYGKAGRSAMNRKEVYGRQWKAASPKGAVVLVHGQFEHSGRYTYAASVLTAGGYHVYSGDLPRHGLSGGLRGHIDRFQHYIDTVASWAAEAREDNPGLPVFLLGHSVGGLIVTRYLQTSGDASSFAGA